MIIRYDEDPRWNALEDKINRMTAFLDQVGLFKYETFLENTVKKSRKNPALSEKLLGALDDNISQTITYDDLLLDETTTKKTTKPDTATSPTDNGMFDQFSSYMMCCDFNILTEKQKRNRKFDSTRTSSNSSTTSRSSSSSYHCHFHNQN